jgi:hypothetical protein
LKELIPEREEINEEKQEWGVIPEVALELSEILTLSIPTLRYLAPRDPIPRGTDFWQRVSLFTDELIIIENLVTYIYYLDSIHV